MSQDLLQFIHETDTDPTTHFPSWRHQPPLETEKHVDKSRQHIATKLLCSCGNKLMQLWVKTQIPITGKEILVM
jgi:hypothetical protein